MATIERIKRKKGNAYLLRFYNGGRRFKICLPVGLSRAAVDELARIVDDIVNAQRFSEALPRRAVAYLQTAPPLILNKLAAVGLVAIEKPLLLADAISDYKNKIAGDLKPHTMKIKTRALNLLEAHFGAATPVASITADAARAFLMKLAENFAQTTVEFYAKANRAFFASLVAADALPSNPFAKLPVKAGARLERAFDVPSEWTAPILDACPSALERALFCVYRFGGLRNAEALALRWSGVNWERRRLLVPSEKTARFGRDARVIPLFPEIESALSDLFETLPEGAPDLIFNFSRRLAFARIRAAVIRAGLQPWQKLLQNMRATRENELIAAGFPAHVVAAWMGHTSATQQKYYLRVMDDYFERALAPSKYGAKNGAIEKNNLIK